ncbi:MAG: hypothetical protein M3270_01590 [Thermoproteota archaeon]|nr:hypothetical protein [Thermoproteota archaeon]
MGRLMSLRQSEHIPTKRKCNNSARGSKGRVGDYEKYCFYATKGTTATTFTKVSK